MAEQITLRLFRKDCQERNHHFLCLRGTVQKSLSHLIMSCASFEKLFSISKKTLEEPAMVWWAAAHGVDESPGELQAGFERRM